MDTNRHEWLRWLSAWVAFVISFAPAGAEEADERAFPVVDSIKGLQVQMTGDALSLGVRHATINVPLTPMADAANLTGGYNEAYLRSLDAQIEPLAEAGVVVYAILLATPSKDAERAKLVIHPGVPAGAKFQIAGFNASTVEGKAWLRRTMEMLARRWKGKVWGWIVGNEVNSHWMWYHMGRMPLEQAASEYEKAYRVVHESVKSVMKNARTYVSMDHHWNIGMHGISAEEAVPGRDFLDTFARIVRERGDLDWNLAHHPYPEDLGNPRVWADKNITTADDTIKVTFKNLEVLHHHLARKELLYEGSSRRVILSEQGFHTPKGPDGETLQAAAYAYAWEKCQRVPVVDAFIYHRHVDHSKEGGVRFGLWTGKPGTIADPDKQKKLYHLFKAAGTVEWEKASAFALPVCGFKSWDEAWP
jgi:hypothetical protein